LTVFSAEKKLETEKVKGADSLSKELAGKHYTMNPKPWMKRVLIALPRNSRVTLPVKREFPILTTQHGSPNPKP